MAAASVPSDQSQHMWQCSTVGCLLIHAGVGHRHCCSRCPETNGARHTRRCRGLQHALASGQAVGSAATITVCTTDACNRPAGVEYATRCSKCHRSSGRRHSHRCDSLQQRVPATQLVATRGHEVSSAGSSSSSPAAGNHGTAMVQQVTGTSLSLASSSTAWNTQQSVLSLTNEARHPEQELSASCDLAIDLDKMDWQRFVESMRRPAMEQSLGSPLAKHRLDVCSCFHKPIYNWMSIYI